MGVNLTRGLASGALNQKLMQAFQALADLGAGEISRLQSGVAFAQQTCVESLALFTHLCHFRARLQALAILCLQYIKKHILSLIVSSGMFKVPEKQLPGAQRKLVISQIFPQLIYFRDPFNLSPLILSVKGFQEEIAGLEPAMIAPAFILLLLVDIPLDLQQRSDKPALLGVQPSQSSQHRYKRVI